MILLAEQDGVPERELKRHISSILERFPVVHSAYLVRLQLDALSPPSVALFLCVSGTLRDRGSQLLSMIESTFTEMFGCNEHMDVIFATEQQADRLYEFCAPFFHRTAHDD